MNTICYLSKRPKLKQGKTKNNLIYYTNQMCSSYIYDFFNYLLTYEEYDSIILMMYSMEPPELCAICDEELEEEDDFNTNICLNCYCQI